MWTYDYGCYWGLGSIASLIWFIISVVILVAIVRWVFGGGRRRHWRDYYDIGGRSSALDLLNERYAKGEIDKREYEEKRQDLSR